MTAQTGNKPRGRSRLLVLGVALLIVLLVFLYALGTGGQQSSSPSSSTIETTSYDVGATSVISAAAAHAPSGYSPGPSKQLNPDESGLVSGGYSLFSTQSGALANMTVLVFSSQASAERYIDSVISNAESLSGYSNATATLAPYQHYGVCYGYAEADPEGGGSVANGVCTKGNVYIQIFLASGGSLTSAESDMSAFVGSAYGGVG